MNINDIFLGLTRIIIFNRKSPSFKMIFNSSFIF
nr:MAG TPA: hypothetical protein [Bacteriophage sp.]